MITIYGASGHAKVVRDLIIDQDRTIAAVIDDNKNVINFQGVEVLRREDIPEDSKLVFAIGSNKLRKELSEKNVGNIVNALVHSKATVTNDTHLGKGTVVMPKAVINASSILGDHCIINTGAIVEHDCIIASFVHISPGSIVTGNVNIGEGAHIGAGAIILPGVKIGSWSVVGAGAVVLRDVPSNVTVIGNPAKILEKTKQKNE